GAAGWPASRDRAPLLRRPAARRGSSGSWSLRSRGEDANQSCPATAASGYAKRRGADLMGLRENLRDALPDDQFNAEALMARAKRGAAQPPARRQWAAIGGALLLASAAVTTLVTIRFTHTTTPAHAPATAPASPQPAAPLDNSFAGLLDYQFPAPESGWVHLFTPKGTTLVYHTADGGHRWAEQLRVDGLGGPTRLQAIDARQAVLVVNVNIAGTTPGPVRVYSTS